MKINSQNTNRSRWAVLGLSATAFMSAASRAQQATPTAPGTDALIAAMRTPAAPATPRINGARVYGARPGRPFLFHVPATGDRPMTYAASGLPQGLLIDAATGNITGQTSTRGTFKATVTATNAKGADSKPLSIVIGDAICLTPPMGWNSWNFFAGRVTDRDIRGAAESMTSTGLIEHGWTYVNIDDTWELGRSGDTGRDAQGRILTNEKFPDMKALSDYIHAKGLKFGIYSSPGPTTCAGYTATWQHEDLDALSYAEWGVDYVKYDLCSYSQIITNIKQPAEYAKLLTAEDAAELKRLMDLRATFPPPPRGGRGRGAAAAAPATTPGAAPTYQSVNAQITSLYGKIDPEKRRAADVRMQQEPYIRFRQSLDEVNRDIVYSLCQYGNANVWEWGTDVAGANLWRTTGDITATYATAPGGRGGGGSGGSLTNIGFGRTPPLNQKYAGPGHWNDPDMLEVGNGRLTPDENYTHMTQWCILAAPLLIGCDMPNMNPLIKSMFENDEVLGVDQDALGVQGQRVRSDGTFGVDGAEQFPSTATFEIWAKPLADGTTAVALYNRGAEAKQITATWQELKLNGAQPVRDLWRQKDLPAQSSGLTATVAPHGAELFRVGTPRP